jgi:ABC-2 type transport system permease protein
MNRVGVIFRRELASYFATPVAYVFIFIFLFLAGIFTFYMGSFFERGQADLQPFFNYHPYLYLFLIPAISMRLWSEERRSGTVELLLTLPISMGAAVVGKFLAAWCFTAIALAGTITIWITVNGLGSPDNGIVVASYLGSLLMAGAYLAIGSCISALTKNQVIAFVVTVVVCFLFVVSGLPIVTGFFESWLTPGALEVVANASFLTNYENMVHGVIDVRNVVYFLSVIAVWLLASALAIDARKAN